MINSSFPLVCSRYVFFSFFFFQILEKMKLENPTYESIVAKETSFSASKQGKHEFQRRCLTWSDFYVEIT